MVSLSMHPTSPLFMHFPIHQIVQIFSLSIPHVFRSPNNSDSRITPIPRLFWSHAYSDPPIIPIPRLYRSPDYSALRSKVTTTTKNILPAKATAILNTTKIAKSTILQAAITVYLNKKMRL